MIGDMFVPKAGVGFMIVNAVDFNNTKTIMATTIFVVLAAATANSLLQSIGRRLNHEARVQKVIR
jgi:ABC-type nitrate/sulfonate/bicarbonate transport system permease component